MIFTKIDMLGQETDTESQLLHVTAAVWFRFDENDPLMVRLDQFDVAMPLERDDAQLRRLVQRRARKRAEAFFNGDGPAENIFDDEPPQQDAPRQGAPKSQACDPEARGAVLRLPPQGPHNLAALDDPMVYDRTVYMDPGRSSPMSFAVPDAGGRRVSL